jgi:hypothetical protein
VQTAEGELTVEIPQVREAAEPFVSTLFPRGTKLLRTEPLRAMVIGVRPWPASTSPTPPTASNSPSSNANASSK